MSCRYFTGLLLCLVLALGLTGRARAEQIDNFLVFYSNNVNGEMEPCG